jgi:creatinine amidohydrolase
MSWSQLGQVLAGRTPPVVLLPLGAVEAHGPHLPLDTDTVIAQRLGDEIAVQLADGRKMSSIVAHPVPITAASWAADFPGTISLSAAAARLVLRDAIASLRLSGAGRIALVNLHFDPEHVAAVREVVKEDRGGGLAFPDFTKRAMAQRIGGEFATGSCHGGLFETSLMLAARPEAVQPAYRDLPRIDFDLPAAIRAGKKSFRQVGLDQAYCGDPAHATAEEGQRLFRLLASIFIEVALTSWSGPPAAIA